MSAAAATTRKPRSIGATASYLNAGLWGSRFVGNCEIVTNGERVWVTGTRIPVWMTLARVASFVAFLPVGFYTGVMVGETVLGHRGYPPYYYLMSALLTFLLIVLGMWGSGIWHESLGSDDTVSWPAPKGRSLMEAYGEDQTRGHGVWSFLNKFFNVTGSVQIHVPIGPGGKPRRLVLKTKDTGVYSLMSVLSGAYYGQTSQEAIQMARGGDPWGWTRNN
jgi:hypothetical protein